MTISAVYTSGTFMIRIGSQDLTNLLLDGQTKVALSLKGETYSGPGVYISLDPETLAILREVVKVETRAREEARLQIRLSNPGYKTHDERRNERRKRGKS